MLRSFLPLRISGIVSHGKGRGSTQLGFPTANVDDHSAEYYLKDVEDGVYFGFSFLPDIQGEKVEPMVMSVGKNTTFNEDKRVIEIHVLKKYPETFYGKLIKAIAVGYIRGMKKFESIGELISGIESDIKFSKEMLINFEHYRDDSFFKDKSKTY